MYMMPIFLWSALVSQCDHSGRHKRYLVSRATNTMAPTTTRDAAPVSMQPLMMLSLVGCWNICQNGSEAHSSRPSGWSNSAVMFIAHVPAWHGWLHR